MALSAAEAQRVTRAFTEIYPRATDLAFKFRGTLHGLYKDRSAELPPTVKAAYHPTPFVHRGRTFLGRVDVVLNNAKDAQDLRDSLRHEIIGHFGLNTFTPTDKRALLDAVVTHRNEPSLQPHWSAVESAYPGKPLHVKAEEVVCLRAETVAPEHHIGRPHVMSAGARAFDDTVRHLTRPMTAQDLDRIVHMVAHGLHDRSRTQQTFPSNDDYRRAQALTPHDPHRAALRAEAFLIAERLAQLDGPTAVSPFKHPDLQAHYRDVQRQPVRQQAIGRDRGR